MSMDGSGNGPGWWVKLIAVALTAGPFVVIWAFSDGGGLDQFKSLFSSDSESKP